MKEQLRELFHIKRKPDIRKMTPKEQAAYLEKIFTPEKLQELFDQGTKLRRKFHKKQEAIRRIKQEDLDFRYDQRCTSNCSY
jgi:hypothetical protein